MQRASQPFRRAEVLAVLLCVVLSLTLLILPDNTQILVADRLGGVLTAPWRQASNFVDDVVQLRRRNEALLEELTARDLESAARQREALVPDSAGELDPALAQVPGPLLACQVEARQSGRFVTMIRIKSSVPANLKPYQPVMSHRGLLGWIRRVTGPDAAWVELMNGPGFALGCEIQRTGLLGVLRPWADGFQLTLVGRDEDVRVGDHIYTSGIAEIREDGLEPESSALMPRGLPVGVVLRVEAPHDKLFKSIWVVPTASFTRNSTVFVVGAEERPDALEASTPAEESQ